ncbi:chorismate synthase [Halanaerobium congolense]|jgi:chorismate synthase|uniref:chorismate synthase n=1 Tax=Halanaerobium congolense TaxID=54121 RepID=UPI000885A6E8|nr:chorismate synthase [Halanaerobium congolense]SDK39545.1 chorismate synthase [Halanaerobium congolense]SDM04511.1 chorismate synthase [Halanaerobium congolense]
MSGSILGDMFKISTWGESHGKALGVVIDGCPAGLEISAADIQRDLDRRKPGQSPFATPRKEGDKVEILSGIFEGKTTGTPISLIIFNKNQKSKDYSALKDIYRPAQSDLSYDLKYGFRDHRGSGRASGRETAARAAAGAIAKKVLAALDVKILAYTASIGPVKADPKNFNEDYIMDNFLYMPDSDAVKKAEDYLNELIEKNNSSGGTIECIVKNIPSGLGDPVFDKCDALLARAVMSIGAVKGVEIGSGFDAAEMTGYEHNDFYRYQAGEINKLTNNAGGTLGGITEGSDILLKAAVKPTPSIEKTQQAVNKSGENIELSIKGRHDPVIVPRAVVVVEAMAALTLVDLLLKNMSSRMEYLKRVY